jgi:hypothetical protein
MKKLLIIIVLILVVLFSTGYLSYDYVKEKSYEKLGDALGIDSEEKEVAPETTLEETEEPVIEEPTETEPEETNGCETNADCGAGTFCIDTECGTIDNLYKTEGCTEKCNFNSVVIETSDGQTFTLNRGQGDYTAAGALEWTLASGPDYCPESDDIIVPVKIKKKNAGKLLSEQYLTVLVGETSEVVTHPTIKSVQFTFTIKSVEEECG